MKHNELGALVRDVREYHGLSQAVLGQLLGLSRATVTKIEAGERRLQTDELLTLTQLFGDRFEFCLLYTSPSPRDA